MQNKQIEFETIETTKKCSTSVGGYVAMINDVHDTPVRTHASVQDDEQQRHLFA